NYLHDLTIDGYNNKWVSSNSGVSKFDGTAFTNYTTYNSDLPNNEVNDVVVDAQNNIWFGTNNGVSRFDGMNFLTYATPSSIGSNYLHDLTIDGYNNKWVSSNSGVSKFDGINWTNYTTEDGLAGLYAMEIAFDQQNNAWIGGWGVSMYDGNTFTNYSDVDGLISMQVYSIAIDKNNIIWIGTNSGVSKFDGTTFTNYTTTDGLINNQVNKIAIDTNNVVWFCTPYGLSGYDGTDWTNYTSSNGLIVDGVEDIFVDCNNNKWVLNYNALCKFNDTVFTYLMPPPSYLTVALGFIDQNDIWLGTSGKGLLHWNGSSWAEYNTSHGIINNYITDIEINVFDKNLWISSVAGLTEITCAAPYVNFIADTACLTQITSFTDLSKKTDNHTIFYWDFENNNIIDDTLQNPSFIYSNPGIFEVKLTAINGTCKDSLIKPIKVNSYPDVSIIPQSTLNLCVGNSVQLNAVITNIQSGNNYSYLWSNGSSSQNISVYNSDTYNVTVTNENCAASDTTDITVFVQEPYQDEEICLVTVDTLTWKNKITWEKTPDVGTIGYYVYKELATNYYTSIGFIAYTDSPELIDYASQPESYGNRYKISLVDSCFNESTLSYYHNTMNLTIAAFGSTMGLSWTPYIDESGLFTPSMYYIYKGTTPMTMQLYDSIPGTQTSYNDNNVYSLYYYLVGVKRDPACNQGGTSFSNRKDNGVFVILAETKAYLPLSIYPNPASETVTIEFPNPENEPYTISITDITGKQIQTVSRSLSGARSVTKQSLDISSYAPGIYYIEIKGNENYKGKLIVQ
ncbi:MAG: T9SS type A sorting domain-containing protein, partial [Bacteroidota bacterium]